MNTPLSLVTDEELKVINCQIDNTAEASCNVSIPYLLREWNKKKTPIFNQVFGGKSLIMSKQISFTKSWTQIADEMCRSWETSLSSKARLLYSAFSSFCCDMRHKIRCDEFDNWRYDITPADEELEFQWYRCENMLCNEFLAENKIKEEFTIPLPKPDGTTRDYRVQKGSRPLRVLSQIMKAYPSFFDQEIYREGFKDFNLWQSRMLNDKKLEGELCLSIHPLDYMTMSENTCDWSSCMNWPEGGCYRGGTIEMMNSPMVIVVYLKSKDPLKMDAGWSYDGETGRSKHKSMDWNSKKWRTLIVVNDTGIYSVKAYPYQHNELTTFAMEWIASCIKDRKFKEPCEFRPYRSFTLEGMRIETISPRTSRMYNDFGSTEHYAMFDVAEIKKRYEKENDNSLVITFNYSGASECMSCGELLYIDDIRGDISFESECQLCCNGCDPDREPDTAYCDCCGDAFDAEDGTWVGDSYVCPDCLDRECFEDAWSGDYHFNDDRIELFIDGEDKTRNVGFVCIWNLKNRWYKDPEDKEFLKKLQGDIIHIKPEELNETGYSYYKSMLAREERTKALFANIIDGRNISDMHFYYEAAGVF